MEEGGTHNHTATPTRTCSHMDANRARISFQFSGVGRSRMCMIVSRRVVEDSAGSDQQADREGTASRSARPG